jgi:SHS2 domain-containing protein
MMDASPDWLREIDHTGDIGIAVRAGTLSELFERAAWGMFGVLTDMDTVRDREARAVTVEADDRASLMVRWLSELNFLHATQHVLFSRFAIEEMTDTRLAATAWGEAIDPDRHTVYTEIKAITYHQLEIEETDDGWHVQIIFDM